MRSLRYKVITENPGEDTSDSVQEETARRSKNGFEGRANYKKARVVFYDSCSTISKRDRTRRVQESETYKFTFQLFA